MKREVPHRSIRSRARRLSRTLGGQALLTGIGGGMGWATGERILRGVGRGGRKLKLLRLFARKAARVHV